MTHDPDEGCYRTALPRWLEWIVAKLIRLSRKADAFWSLADVARMKGRGPRPSLVINRIIRHAVVVHHADAGVAMVSVSHPRRKGWIPLWLRLWEWLRPWEPHPASIESAEIDLKPPQNRLSLAIGRSISDV
jgi:hypothetical protein